MGRQNWGRLLAALGLAVALGVLSAGTAVAASASPSSQGPGRPGGIVPRRASNGRPAAAAVAAGIPAASGNATPSNGAINPTALLKYHGGPVMHTHRIHAIFWAPPGYSFPTGYEVGVETFLQDVAVDSGKTSNPYGAISQYGDSGGPATYNVTYGGSVLVTDPLPSTDPNCLQYTGTACLMDYQLASEANAVRMSQGWGLGFGDQYVLLTPPGIDTCFDASGDCSFNVYCAYHSWSVSSLLPLIYLHIPFQPPDACHGDGFSIAPMPNGQADVANDLISHEEREAATDPLLNAWYDDFGFEADDKCIDDYGTIIGFNGAFVGYNQAIGSGVYDTQTEWSNAKRGCYQMGPPKITAVAPLSAPTGSSVGISGENFFFAVGTTPNVRFNGVQSPNVTVDSPTHLTAEVPVGKAGGKIAVAGVGGTGTSSQVFGVQPTVTSLSVTHGFTGTVVTVGGGGFIGVTGVKVNGVAGSFSAVNASGTSLNFVIPAGATTGPITVTTSGGTGSSASTAGPFTVDPKITSFAPTSAHVGDVVTLAGSGFGASGETRSLTLNGVAASVTWVSATSVKFTVPAGATTGTIQLTVGTALPFTAGPALKILPRITGYSVVSGLEGDSVTVQGTTLDGATSLKFGNVMAAIGSIAPDGSSIQTSVPAGALTGTVTVVTPGGTATGPVFKVLPTIDPLVTTHGFTGLSVTLTGKTFTGTSSVKVGGVSAPFALSSGQLKVTIPQAAVTGPIAVTNAGGTSLSTVFTVDPKITSFSPASATVGGLVAVTGSGFGASGESRSLTVNGVSASVTWVSATSVKFTVPPGATTGTLQLTVGSALPFTSVASLKVVPKVTGYSPAAAREGDPVTVQGTTLDGATSLKFGNVVAAIGSIAPDGSSIQTTVPAGALTGTVTVVTPGGSSVGPAFKVLPTVDETFAPTHGFTGTAIVVTGKTFSGVNSVKIGGVASPFALQNGQLKVTVPSAAVSGPISVTNAGGTTTTVNTFTVDPKITSFSPASAAVGGLVTVTGTGFGASGETRTLSVNGVSASVTWVSATSVKVTVPPGATTGTLQLTVGGALPSTTAATLKVVPRVTGYSPASAREGDPVTVQGTTLDGATSLKFGNVVAAIGSIAPDGSSIQTTVPVGALTGTVTVVTPGGSSVGPAFKVLPTVAETFTPTHGFTGTAIVVSGKTFSGVNSVKIGGVAAPFALQNGQLKVTVPSAAVSGPISVTNAGGTTTTVNTFTVDPKITSFAPASAAVGATITVNGSGFGGADRVDFTGGASATPTSVTPTSLKVAVPQGAAAGPLQVHTAAGLSPASAGSFTVTLAVTSISPAFGNYGDDVTVNGLGLTGVTAVKFNGIAGAIQPGATATVLHVHVPAAGAVTGHVTVWKGATNVQAPQDFTLLVISSVTPGNGTPGAPVVLAGHGFTGATSVTFNGTAATFTVNNDAQITTRVPATAASGPIAVTVPAGTVTTSTFAVSDPSVVINEFATGTTASTTDEFVELKNTGSTTVDLKGCQLVYSDGTVLVDFTSTTLVTTGSPYVVLGGSGYAGTTAATFTLDLAPANAGLALSCGASVIDRAGWGTVAAAYREGTPATPPAVDHSAARTPDGVDSGDNSADFQDAPTPTPGTGN